MIHQPLGGAQGGQTDIDIQVGEAYFSLKTFCLDTLETEIWFGNLLLSSYFGLKIYKNLVSKHDIDFETQNSGI